eukprot:291505_1
MPQKGAPHWDKNSGFRQILVEELRSAVTDVVSFASLADTPVPASNPRCILLLICIERCFTYGLKKGRSMLSGAKTFFHVVQACSAIPPPGSSPWMEPDFKAVRALSLSAKARARAWIRQGLNRRHLDENISSLARQTDKISQFYEDFAVLSVAQSVWQVVDVLVALRTVSFDIFLTDPNLDNDEVWESITDVFRATHKLFPTTPRSFVNKKHKKIPNDFSLRPSPQVSKKIRKKSRRSMPQFTRISPVPSSTPPFHPNLPPASLESARYSLSPRFESDSDPQNIRHSGYSANTQTYLTREGQQSLKELYIQRSLSTPTGQPTFSRRKKRSRRSKHIEKQNQSDNSLNSPEIIPRVAPKSNPERRRWKSNKTEASTQTDDSDLVENPSQPFSICADYVDSATQSHPAHSSLLTPAHSRAPAQIRRAEPTGTGRLEQNCSVIRMLHASFGTDDFFGSDRIVFSWIAA